MNENGEISGIYSWPAIICMLIFFWPIGLYLLWKRLSVDKKTALESSKLLNIFAKCSYVFAVLGFVSCIGDDAGTAVFGLIFFGICGLALQKMAKKIKDNAEKVRQYLAIIVNGNETQLDNIATAIGKTYEQVKVDVQELIDKNYLKNAYINEGERCVVLPNSQNKQFSQSGEANTSGSGPVNKLKVVTCKCCGANNSISVDGGECEYCGSPLE